MTRWHTVTAPDGRSLRVRARNALVAAYEVGPRLLPPQRGFVGEPMEVEVTCDGGRRKARRCRVQLILDYVCVDILTDKGAP
jgi:hypothetical protein